MDIYSPAGFLCVDDKSYLTITCVRNNVSLSSFMSLLEHKEQLSDRPLGAFGHE